MHHPPKFEIKGKDITFGSRSRFHKMARIVYKVFRCFYVSAVFYYMPLAVVVLQAVVNPISSETAAAH